MSKYLARIAKFGPSTVHIVRDCCEFKVLKYDIMSMTNKCHFRDIIAIVYTLQFAGLHMRNEECYTMEARHCTLALSSPGYCCSSRALM